MGLFLGSLSAYSDSNLETDVNYADNQATISFIAEMRDEHGFSQQELEEWFASATKKQSIIDAISRPAEKALTWAEYRKIFLTKLRIDKGVSFWDVNADTLTKAEAEFGVPAEIIVAIIGVETLYGERQGRYRVIDALSTLAFDYPPRSQFFRRELKEFLLLAREQKHSPLELQGSYAGAMGYGQFIPSSYRAYAVDYTDDGFADIWTNPDDAIGSVANYFKRHGWKTGEAVAVRSRVDNTPDANLVNQSLKPWATVAELKQQGFIPVKPLNDSAPAAAILLNGEWGDEYWLGLYNFYVITRDNHSRLFAMAVWQLSQEIAAARK